MDVSIIVPIYNVAPYLDACLASAAGSVGALEAEFLLVDDASEDGSAEIAAAWERKDPRFRLFRLPHGGLSRARNSAVPHAAGKYIQFLDSDDLLEPLATEGMFRLAEETGSDLAVCHVARVKDGRASASSLHALALSQVRESVTHISRAPSLVYDSTAWNKLIRRDFYLENGFSFPEGFTYEDMPVMTAVHCAANRACVWGRTGYLWRIRPDSITRTPTPANMEDKAEMMELTMQEAAARGFPQPVREALLIKFLVYDLPGFLSVLGKEGEEACAVFCERLSRFVDAYCGPDILRLCPVGTRQVAESFARRDFRGLAVLGGHLRWAYPKAPVSRTPGGLTLSLPASLYPVPDRDAEPEFTCRLPRQRVTDVARDGDRVTLTGFLLFDRLAMAPGEQEIGAVIRNVRSGREMRLEAAAEESSQATAEFGSVACYDDWRVHCYGYGGAGYRVSLDLGALRGRPDFAGDNLLFLHYSNPAVSGWVELAIPSPAARKALAGITVSEDHFSCRFLCDRRGAVLLCAGEEPLPAPPVRHSEVQYRKVARALAARKKELAALAAEKQALEAAEESLRGRADGLEEELRAAAEREERLREELGGSARLKEEARRLREELREKEASEVRIRGLEEENAALRAEVTRLSQAGLLELISERLRARRGSRGR